MITITNIGSVHMYETESDAWDSPMPRSFHFLAYQYTSKVSHILHGKELLASPDCLLFLHQRDFYHAKAHTQGASMCVAFQAEGMPDSFCMDCRNIPEVLGLYKLMYDHRQLHLEENYYFCMSKLYEVLGIVQKKYFRTVTNNAVPTKTQEIYNYILNWYSDQDLSSEKLEKIFHISGQHMRNLFHKAYQTTPYQFLLETRIQEAKRLLDASELPLSQIARTVGIQDVYYFSKVFKKHTNVSPKEYRHRVCD